MYRKAFAALAALSLAAQPALAQDPPKKDREGSHILTKQTLLPLGIIVGLAILVFVFTLHTKNNGKKQTSP